MSFGSATPDLAATDRAARAVIRPLLARGEIAVVPGFLGVSPDGAVTTLGRGGSDLSATLLARALDARAVSLWKDVPGLLTCDPRLVPHTSVIAQLHPREAAELAYYGAKVLHPRALIPLARRAMPLYVRPFANPDSAGTEVSARRPARRYPVKALSISADQAMITVAGNGMLGVPGIAARTFGDAAARGDLGVAHLAGVVGALDLLQRAGGRGGARAAAGCRTSSATEIANREIDTVTSRDDVATIAIVGLGIGDMPGTASRVFEALSSGGINVVAHRAGLVGAQPLGGGRRVERRDRAAAHPLGVPARPRGRRRRDARRARGRRAARLRRDRAARGGADRAQRAQERRAARRRDHRSQRLRLRCGWTVGAAHRARHARRSARGKGIASLPRGHAACSGESLAHIARHALARPVCIDVTADETTPLLMDAVRAGMDIVMANKRPLTRPAARVRELRALAAERGARIRAETTVGAALPILDTYAKLVESGDRVRRIDACPSGTLGFLFDELGRGATSRPRCATRWRAATRSPIRATISRGWTSRARR